jgi:hypothetical protein
MAIRKSKPPARDGITYRDGAGTEIHDGSNYPQEHRSFDELATGGRVMKRKEHEREEEREHEGEHHRKERAAGGRTGRSNEQGEEGSGSPEFFGGAESPTARAAHGDRQAKDGGAIKKKRKARKRGGAAVEGHDAHRRLDRARGGRTRMHRAGGGMVGSDSKPLTEANKLTPPKGSKATPADNPEDD